MGLGVSVEIVIYIAVAVFLVLFVVVAICVLWAQFGRKKQNDAEYNLEPSIQGDDEGGRQQSK